MFDDWTRRSKEADTDVVARVLGGVHYVRVQIRLEMNYKNIVSRSNQLELSGKAIKKPGQGDIDGTVSSLGTNMNMLGQSELDMSSHGRGMLNSGPGAAGNGAFTDIAQTLPDVKALLQQEVEQTDEEATDEELGQDAKNPNEGLQNKGNGGGTENSQGKEHKQVFQDIAQFKVEKEHLLEDLFTTLQKDVQACHNELSKELQVCM